MSEYIDIIGKIRDNSIAHTVTTTDYVLDSTENTKQSIINQQFKNKIALLENTNTKNETAKGYFTSMEVLESTYNSPEVGDWAIVYNNGVSKIAVCETQGTWTLTDQIFETKQLDLNEYQKKLISGTNIKTINGKPILIEEGSGVININTNEDLPYVSNTSDGILTSLVYSQLMTLRDITVPNISENLATIQTLIDTDPEQIEQIINNYQTIQKFIEGLSEEDKESLLNELTTLVTNEINRATTKENSLETAINSLQQYINSLNLHKQIFLTESEYEAITTPDDNTLYYIIEGSVPTTWTFGNTFPIILS